MTRDDFPLPTATLAAVLGCTDSQLRTARTKAALVEGQHFIRQPIAGFQGGAHRLAFTIPGCIAIAQVLGTTHALEFADRCQQLLDGSGAIVPLDRGQLSSIPKQTLGT